MEFNVSSFYDGEESSKHLNSTALEQDENEQKEWKLSPITAEERRTKTSIFHKHSHLQSSEFKSPLRTINTTDPSTSGYDSKSTTAGTPQQSSSSEQKMSELSSFVANNSLNPFDSIFLNSLHKSITFSPRLVISSQESGSQQKDGEKFQWSVEQLAILKPAHISDDEIAANYRSPIPEVEEKIQEALNEYWTKNVSYIPSPDGPRFVNLTHRDGTVTTIRYGEATTSSSNTSEGTTPSLANIIRKKEAVKAAYATSSPKQRPRKNLRQVRNRTCQTELTIPPSMDLDLKKLLGDNFIYQADQEMEDEEVFNVSVSSNFSTRRRLFSTSGQQEEEEEADDVANSSMLSTDDLLLNESSSQAFNDSLSPVRRSQDITEDIDEGADSMEQGNTSTTSGATRSHASQIAINISILNDCMMNSIDEAENEEEEQKPEENEEDVRRRVFSDSHIHANEYEMLDRSSSSNATPRHEDLDWTPRRFPGSVTNSVVRGPGTTSSGSFGSGGSAPQELRRFVFDMSPIHPNHNLPASMRTPIQRCHLNLPQGRLDLNDEDDDVLDDREK